MKAIQVTVFTLFFGLLNWTTNAQIEDFLTVNKPMAVDFKDNEMYMILNSSGGPVSDGAVAKVDLTDLDLNIEILVDNLIYPRALHIVDEYLYYAVPTSIRRINLTDSNPVPELVVSGTNYVRAFSLIGDELYLAENDKISKINLSQANLSKVTVIDGFTEQPLALEALNGELYIAYGHNVSKINVSESNPVLTDVLINLVGKIYGMDFYEGYLYIEQSHNYPSGQKNIMKYNVAQNDFNFEDVVTYDGGLTIIDVKFHENNLYIAFAGFANKISILEDADTLSVEQFTFQDKIQLSPNPATYMISLSNLNSDLNYSIIDINGKILKNGVVKRDQSIMIEELNSGIYFLKTNNNTLKFIKQ